jgi:Predicted UDP-glucose 6-dehydrogenase
MYDALLDADALLMVTEWKQFRLPAWGVIKKTMRTPVVIDGRNIYDIDELKAMDITYHCIGK